MDEQYVTDSCPVRISVTEPDGDAEREHFDAKSEKSSDDSEEEEEEKEEEGVDEIFAGLDDMIDDANVEVKMNNVQITGSSDIHIGNKYTDNKQITVAKAKKVNYKFVDNRHFISLNQSPTHEVPQLLKCFDMGRKKGHREEQHMLKVQRFLCNYYKVHCKITRPLPWSTDISLKLQEFYTSLQIIRTTRKGQHATTMEALFTLSRDEDVSLRLLVEGNPGYGKTTLAVRLAHDWARQSPYMKAFDLVFLIMLRDFKGDLRQHLFKECHPLEESKDQELLWEYVKSNQEGALFILDGLDELNPAHEQDIVDLIRGRLLGQVSVVVMSRPLQSCNELLKVFPTRVVLQGFTNEQIRNFVAKYFEDARNPDSGNKLLETLFDPNRVVYRSLAECPLMCQLLCVLFEDKGGEMPSKATEVYKDLIAFLLGRALFSKTESSFNAIPEQHDKMLKNFGKLCVDVLRTNRVYFTTDEIRSVFPGDSAKDFGFLVRSLEDEQHSQKHASHFPRGECYQPLHKTFIEYLAAYYLHSLFTKGSKEDMESLRHELIKLKPAKNLESNGPKFSSSFLVLKYLMGLLGKEAHRLLPLVSTFQLQPVFLFDLLKESGTFGEGIASVLPSLAEQTEVSIYSDDNGMEGWSHIIVDSSCVISSLAFRKTQSCSAEALDSFFAALAVNQSVEKLSIEYNYMSEENYEEVQRLAHLAGLVLRKKNLKELSLTCCIYSEDQYGEDFVSQCMISAIVESIMSYTPECLSVLNLSFNLNSGHLRQLRPALLHVPTLRTLKLSKLWCGVKGFQVLANTIATHPNLHELALMTNMTKVFSPNGIEELGKGLPALEIKKARRHSRVMDDENIENELMVEEFVCPCGCSSSRDFSANPRLSPTPTKLVEALSFPPVAKLFDGGNERFKLHFNKGTGYYDIQFPSTNGRSDFLRAGVPTCLPQQHDEGFHHLFASLKIPQCQLTTLQLRECYMSNRDHVCLGEAIRKTKTIKTFELVEQNLEGLLPMLLIALSENTTIESLNLKSTKKLIVNDIIFELFCRSLQGSSNIKNLNISGWTFDLKDYRSFDVYIQWLTSMQLESVDLSSCHIFVSLSAPENRSEALLTYKELFHSAAKSLPSCYSVQILNLDRTKISVKGSNIQQSGHMLLPLITCFPALKRLNLGVGWRPRLSNLDDNFIDDDMTRTFFSTLGKVFGKTLETLNLHRWRFNLNHPKKTSIEIGKLLCQCEQLATVRLDNVVCLSPGNEEEDMPAWLMESFIRLPKLKLFSLQTKLTQFQAEHFSQHIREKWTGNLLVLQTGMLSEETLNRLVTILQGSNKFDVDYSRESIIIRVRPKPSICGYIMRKMSHATSPTA